MSLYGALNIGVAGLQANSMALSATSSNIANVNTVGYKEARASFSTILNASTGVGNNSSAGVAAQIGQDITTQGLPTTTSSDTDISISGNGFFVVAPNPDGSGPREYTRAGSFLPDVNGNLVNSAGLYLMGYKLDSFGNVPTDASALSLVNTTSIASIVSASTRSRSPWPIGDVIVSGSCPSVPRDTSTVPRSVTTGLDALLTPSTSGRVAPFSSANSWLSYVRDDMGRIAAVTSTPPCTIG